MAKSFRYCRLQAGLLAGILFLAFVFSGCDLLSGAKVKDYAGQLDAEVAWANAPKLNVRIENPNDWGNSNPTEGAITPATDIRKGYPFSIEYLPNKAYSFIEWRAYRTADLPDNWTDYSDTLNDMEQAGTLKRLDASSVIVPDLPLSGGTGNFTINTTDPVTLVPWCVAQPRVTNTNPGDSASMVYPINTPIVINFNALLDPSTGEMNLFQTGAIKITGTGPGIGDDVDISGDFNTPMYIPNQGQSDSTITISPTADVPENCLVTVTVGPNFYNLDGKPMAKSESFSWTTASATSSGGSIASWGASYDEVSKTITVNWTTSGTVTVSAHYTRKDGTDTSLPDTPLPDDKIIRNVSGVDGSDVLAGNQAGGIQEYDIYLDLNIGGLTSNTGSVSFKIWNFTGMSVDQTHPALEIGTADDLAAINTNGLGNPDAKYVLTQDITLNSAWTPIGNDVQQFQGKFYGNGHTITVSGGFANAANTGIFGYVNNAEIRDLTVNYSADAAAGASAVYAGGLVGQAGGSTAILNVIVSGSPGVSLTAGGNAQDLGGIAGYLTDSASIKSSYCALDVSFITANNTVINAGGIVGAIDGTATIASVTAAGQVSVTCPQTAIAGGIAGTSKTIAPPVLDTTGNITAGNIHDAHVTGTVSILDSATGNASAAVCGGIIGYLVDSVVTNSSFEGNLSFFNNITAIGSTFIGGLAGNTGGAYVGDTLGHNNLPIKITNCTINGIIDVKDYGSGALYLGGVSGWTVGQDDYRNITFTNCVYSNGAITVNKLSGNGGSIGGFGGDVVRYTTFNTCCVLARSMKVTISTAAVGGFAGVLRADLEDCYTNVPLEVTYTATNPDGNPSAYTGGLIGKYQSDSQNNNLTIQNCYAAGPVTVSGMGENVFTGGLIGDLGANLLETDYRFGQISVLNCYATGNILADSANTAADARVYSGGLIGYMNLANTSYSVTKCFSTGAVTAQSGYSATVSAGGITGCIGGGSLSNNVALGAFVLAKGASISAGRIYGNLAAGAVSNNFATDAMKVKTGGYAATNYTDKSPLDASDGETASASAFRSQVDQGIWTTNLDFDPIIWDIGSINSTGYGYPLLANVGGQ